MLNLDAVNPTYPIPDWLHEGQEVFTSFDGVTCVACRVAVACGDAARVTNEALGIDRWVSRWHLRIKTAPK